MCLEVNLHNMNVHNAKTSERTSISKTLQYIAKCWDEGVSKQHISQNSSVNTFFFASTCHFVRSLGAHDVAGATRPIALHNLSKVEWVSVKFWIRTVYLWNPRLPPPKDVAANTNEGPDFLRVAPLTRPSCLQSAIKIECGCCHGSKFRTSTTVLLGEHVLGGVA